MGGGRNLYRSIVLEKEKKKDKDSKRKKKDAYPEEEPEELPWVRRQKLRSLPVD